MKRFRYDDVVPASKSHFNRALICASHGSGIKLHGYSACDDVEKMKTAISRLHQESIYDCGSAGTVLRFLALRASRLPGLHILKGHPRLMSRPQADLYAVLTQLGVHVEPYSDRLLLRSPGWQKPSEALRVSREKSSQFLSGLLLNAWDLPFPLRMEWDSNEVSEGYWQMSLQVVRDFGMQPLVDRAGLTVPANAKVTLKDYTIESDLSSAFAIAAYAALNGEANFREFPIATQQPDRAFVQILERMGTGVETNSKRVRIFQKNRTALKGVHAHLGDCPDLFPVLATLCAFAQGPSRLDGAPHLVFKESNRIQKTAELLHHMGVKTTILPDGMEIHPPSQLILPHGQFEYDTDHDHRLAFAASLLESQNYPIRILHREVVRKSFPEFWDVLAKGAA